MSILYQKRGTAKKHAKAFDGGGVLGSGKIRKKNWDGEPQKETVPKKENRLRFTKKWRARHPIVKKGKKRKAELGLGGKNKALSKLVAKKAMRERREQKEK